MLLSRVVTDNEVPEVFVEAAKDGFGIDQPEA